MLRAILIGVVALVALYVGGALTLIHLPDEPPFSGDPIYTPETLERMGVVVAQDYPFDERRFEMRDGAALYARAFGAASGRTILLLHGGNANGLLYNRTAGQLSEATGARVIALDLRGHGLSDGARGDLSYVGQYEDDLADAIDALYAENISEQVVLAGHSMGGGVALRYASKL